MVVGRVIRRTLLVSSLQIGVQLCTGRSRGDTLCCDDIEQCRCGNQMQNCLTLCFDVVYGSSYDVVSDTHCLTAFAVGFASPSMRWRVTSDRPTSTVCLVNVVPVSSACDRLCAVDNDTRFFVCMS